MDILIYRIGEDEDSSIVGTVTALGHSELQTRREELASLLEPFSRSAAKMIRQQLIKVVCIVPLDDETAQLFMQLYAQFAGEDNEVKRLFAQLQNELVVSYWREGVTQQEQLAEIYGLGARLTQLCVNVAWFVHEELPFLAFCQGPKGPGFSTKEGVMRKFRGEFQDIMEALALRVGRSEIVNLVAGVWIAASKLLLPEQRISLL